MDRIVERRVPRVLFHGTSAIMWNGGIRKEGMLRAGVPRPSSYKLSPHGIYLAEDINDAEYFARARVKTNTVLLKKYAKGSEELPDDPRGVVLVVRTGHIIVEPDWEAELFTDGSRWFRCPVDIPKKYVSLHHFTTGCPEDTPVGKTIVELENEFKIMELECESKLQQISMETEDPDEIALKYMAWATGRLIEKRRAERLKVERVEKA